MERATRQKAVVAAGASASRTQSAALEMAMSAAQSTVKASKRLGVVATGEVRVAPVGQDCPTA